MSRAFLHRLMCASLALAAPAAASEWTRTFEDPSGSSAGQPSLARDGSVLLLANAANGMHVLTLLAPDGTAAWRREAPGGWRGATVRSGAAHACIDGIATDGGSQPLYTVQCHTLADGARIWRRELVGVDDPREWRSHGAVLADGRVVLLTYELHPGSSINEPRFETRHRVLAADGTLRLDRHVAAARGAPDAHVAADGTLLVDEGPSDAPVYRVVALDGTLERSVVPQLAHARAALGPDGTVHVLGERAVAGSAAPQLVHSMHPRAAPAGERAIAAFGLLFEARFAFSGADAYAVAALGRSRYFGETSHTLRLSAPTWNRGDALRFAQSRAAVLVDSRDGTPYRVADEGYRFGVERLDGRTGATLHTRWLRADCPFEHSCSQRVFAIGADGALRAAVVRGDYHYRAPALVHALTPPGPRPLARIDQPGIRGAWYPTYAAGQGLVLEWYADSRTLFAPWFTYGPTYGSAWYSLQGVVPVRATRATLDILENRGGTFNSGPETAAVRVGTATLELESCAAGTLDYAFDDGRRGTITLTRLTAATDDCELADGTIEPHGAAPRDGFDARQSGAWYTPGRSGQGVTMTVRPGGAAFVAWFTYDPAGFADDPAAHRWFSMQGDLAAAQDGAVALNIYESYGTLFDGPPATTTQVGNAVLRFTGCGRATIDYQFLGPRLIDRAFVYRAGSLELERIGGCRAD